MPDKPTREELHQRINELEREAVEAKRSQEEKRTRLNSLMAAMRDMRQRVGREKNRQDLLECACDILIERRGYYHAWASLMDESGKIEFAGQSGPDENLLPVMELLKGGELPSCSWKTLEKRDLIVIENPRAACGGCPLAGIYGGGGTMNIPLAHEGKIYGLISACMPVNLVRNEEEQTIFRELANDIGYALHNIGVKEKSQKAEGALKRTMDIVNRSPMVVFLWQNEEGWPIQSVSRNVVDLFGYTADEFMTGEISYSAVVHADDLERVMKEVARHSEVKETPSFRHKPYRIITKDGNEKYVAGLTTIIRNRHGEITHYEGILYDVSDLVRKDAQIKSSLQEKDALLSEIHHRVKNNMQVIISLLRLQTGRIKAGKYADMFKATERRIRSMALVHENLYLTGDFADVDFHGYVKSLVGGLFRSCAVDRERVRVKVEVENVSLGMDSAVPCGLLINEVVLNSLQHAFPGHHREGEIRIDFQQLNGHEVELTIRDDGIGMPEEIDFDTVDSMGLMMVRVLAVDQLDGTVDLDRDGGTAFRICFRISPKS